MSRSGNAQLEAVGQKLLEKFADGEVVRVFLRATHTAPLKQEWSSDGAPEVVGMDGERILGTVEKRQRSVLVYDASKDSLLRGVECPQLKSCLCVPIFDDYKFLIGLIFVSATQENHFSNEDRLELERLSRDCSRLSAGNAEAVSKSSDDNLPGSSLDVLFSAPAQLAGLLMVMLLGIMAIGPARLVDAPQPKATVKTVTGPREASATFAQHLRVGEFADAWLTLAPELRSRWPQAEFVSAFTAWTADELHQQSLLSRKLPVVKQSGSEAEVTFLKPPESDDERDWVWKMTSTESGWQVSAMKGPVDGPLAP